MHWCVDSLRRGGCWRRWGRLGNGTTEYTEYTEGFNRVDGFDRINKICWIERWRCEVG